jgi:hypothetical protein
MGRGALKIKEHENKGPVGYTCERMVRDDVERTRGEADIA